MEPPPRPSSSTLFQVYLRLRPPPSQQTQPVPQPLYPQLVPQERFLTVEPAHQDAPDGLPTHITIRPPSESRKRAVEKFAFTKVFEEHTTQLGIFKGTGAVSLVEGVLTEGRDGLLATLGVTGSGKSHTILGSKSQRGLTQLSLDLLFRSLENKTLHPTRSPSLISSLCTADASEAQMLPASGFLDGIYGDVLQERGNSRAPTPMTVGNESISLNDSPRANGLWNQWSLLGLNAGAPPKETYCINGLAAKKKGLMSGTKDVPDSKIAASMAMTRSAKAKEQAQTQKQILPSQLPFWNTPRLTRMKAKLRFGDTLQDSSFATNTPRRNRPQRPSALPQLPDISDFVVGSTSNADYAIVVSMYEVYNDRIFDLLSHSRNTKELRRRPLLFKSTEGSPDRKVVAGLRKIVCGTFDEALMVLETGLIERRVAGTGSNSVSSRSHGFFCVEVKKRPRGGMSSAWTGSQLTIVDLAGSERARNAKTAGATLQEAGKINESLMFLGQCLQMQSDYGEGGKPSIVPFRQCKLTELLFSNSFPSSSYHATVANHHHRNAQKAVMIVTADPVGDFNATSQILRYSALAREVTVPRLPSVTSTIFTNGVVDYGSTRPHSSNGRNSPTNTARELEVAILELVKSNDEVDILTLRLAEEQARRREAEEAWQAAEDRAEELEREVREECWGEMERRIQVEKRRWMSTWSEEADRNDEHLDRKLEILARGIQVHEDSPPHQSHYTQELETENEALQWRIAALERELQCRSPTKTSKYTIEVEEEGKENVMQLRMDNLTLGAGNSGREVLVPVMKEKVPGKKMRNFTPRNQYAADEEEDEGWTS